MVKYPKCLLTNEDINISFKLDEKVEDYRTRVPEVIAFLKHIEKNYPIKKFFLGNYRPKDIDGNWAIPVFHDPRDFHAARTYVCLYVWLLIFGVDSNSRDKHKKKFYDYCWQEIRRIESKADLYDEGVEIRFSVLYFIELIITVARKLKDTSILVRAFTKLIEYTNYMNEFESLMNIVKQGFETLAIPLEGLVNEALTLLNYPESVSVKHPKLIKCFTQAISYAFDDEPCLILGETGTGKELIARTIHALSQRRDNNFKAVNCGGFTQSLFNSEIQGIVAGGATNVTTRLGAFLKATGKKTETDEYGYIVEGQKIKFRPLKGAIVEQPYEPADDQLKSVGGTVFLDEVNSLNIALQAVFLRIIQENEVQVVGEDITRKFYVKLVCASNSNLFDLVQHNQFREDLYYRLAKGIVEVPPLRELKENFEEIVNNRVEKLCEKIGLEKKIKVPVGVIRKMKRHDWPGNFRELEGVLYRALKKVEIENGTALKPSYVEYEVAPQKVERGFDFSGMKYESLIYNYLKYLHVTTNGNQTHAAQLAGIKRNRLRSNWIKHKIIESKTKDKKRLD